MDPERSDKFLKLILHFYEDFSNYLPSLNTFVFNKRKFFAGLKILAWTF